MSWSLLLKNALGRFKRIEELFDKIGPPYRVRPTFIDESYPSEFYEKIWESTRELKVSGKTTFTFEDEDYTVRFSQEGIPETALTEQKPGRGSGRLPMNVWGTTRRLPISISNPKLQYDGHLKLFVYKGKALILQISYRVKHPVGPFKGRLTDYSTTLAGHGKSKSDEYINWQNDMKDFIEDDKAYKEYTDAYSALMEAFWS